MRRWQQSVVFTMQYQSGYCDGHDLLRPVTGRNDGHQLSRHGFRVDAHLFQPGVGISVSASDTEQTIGGLLFCRWQIGSAGCGHDGNQREAPIRMLSGNDLGDHASHGSTDDMGAFHAESVQHGDAVTGHVDE